MEESVLTKYIEKTESILKTYQEIQIKPTKVAKGKLRKLMDEVGKLKVDAKRETMV